MVGVCIKYFHANYGGMLQAYATISMLQQMGIDYELIRYEKEWKLSSIVKAVPRLLNRVLLNDKYEAIQKRIGLQIHPEFAKNNRIRLVAFNEFNKSHFTKLSPVYKGYTELCEAARKYTAVVTGSDQLWSPAGLPTGFYNLKFVADNIRKVSWASSFGVRNIPWYQKKRTREYLKRIDFISMRENRGAEIVEEILGKKVPVLMDPVFAFDKDAWSRLIPSKDVEWDNYIFCYFLGNNPEYRVAAKRLAEETGRKIITLRHLDRYVPYDESFGDVAPYDVSPERFLNILRNASAVCTDSFHGMAFSIIYEKKFIVFNRYNDNATCSKNTRIDSLSANLGLEDRRYLGIDDIKERMERPIAYENICPKLLAERNATRAYLENALR